MSTFLNMKWKELANTEGSNHRVDWSWLDKPKNNPSVERLWETEWSHGRTLDLCNVGFDMRFVNKVRYRMVMGCIEIRSHV